jgi:hypothetical protein
MLTAAFIREMSKLLQVIRFSCAKGRKTRNFGLASVNCPLDSNASTQFLSRDLPTDDAGSKHL